MSSNWLGVLILCSLGAFGTSQGIDEWLGSTMLPIKEFNFNDELCSYYLDGLFNETDAHLKKYYKKAFIMLCSTPDVRTSVERVDKCVQNESFMKSTFEKCHLAPIKDIDCSVHVEALNCVLDLVGAECGGEEAIRITAFNLEFAITVNTGAKDDNCVIAALQERQKDASEAKIVPTPKTEKLSHQPQACKSLEWYTNRTSSPEYCMGKASQLLCDGNQVKKFVDETIQCFEQVERLPDLCNTCLAYNLDDAHVFENLPKTIQCVTGLISEHCEGPSVIDLVGFGSNLIEILVTDLINGNERSFKCLDEFLSAWLKEQMSKSLPRGH